MGLAKLDAFSPQHGIELFESDKNVVDPHEQNNRIDVI